MPEPYRFRTGDIVAWRYQVRGRIECWQGRDLLSVRIIDNPHGVPHYEVHTLHPFTADELTLVKRADE